MLLSFPLSSVKWWTCCISKQTNQIKVSKTSSVYKTFSSLFPSIHAFQHLDEGVGMPTGPGLQGAHQKSLISLWCSGSKCQTGFLRIHQITWQRCFCLSRQAGQRENRIEPQIRFSGGVLGMRCCVCVVLGLCTWAALPERLARWAGWCSGLWPGARARD